MKLFNREDNKFPILYNPENFQPVQYYGITKEQTKFLIMIKEHLAGLNGLHQIDENLFVSHIINDILSRKRYEESQIPMLMELRNRFGHLYIEKNKV